MLTKENYDTWKIQMRAILIKNDAWGYVSGAIAKPGADATPGAKSTWEAADLKAQSDIILAVSTSEIKQVKNCKTAQEIWKRLEEIFQSKGPARKAALLNSLMSLKMHDGDDPREHSRRFFDIVDKLAELEVDINKELLAVMLLRSLPEKFENFRCAMSSRDELPSLETLSIKIAEEFDARREESSRDRVHNAMIAGKSHKNNGAKSDAKMKCFKCGTVGHRAKYCKKKQSASGSGARDVCLLTEASANETFSAGNNGDSGWCFDSGCTSHMCNDISLFKTLHKDHEHGVLNLASSAKTSIQGLERSRRWSVSPVGASPWNYQIRCTCQISDQILYRSARLQTRDIVWFSMKRRLRY